MHFAKDLQHFFECGASSSCRSVFVPFIGGNFQNGWPRRAISFSPVGLPRIFRILSAHKCLWGNVLRPLSGVAAAGSRSRQPWSRNFVQYAGDGFPPIVYWDVFRMHRVCIFPSVFHETKDPQWLSFLEHLAFSFLFLFRQNSVQDFGSLRP